MLVCVVCRCVVRQCETDRRIACLMRFRPLRRLLLILELLTAKGICWCIENPQSSLIHLADRFQAMLVRIGAYTCTLDLAWFGGSSQKTLKLCPWMPADVLPSFHPLLPAKVVCLAQLASGRLVCTGGVAYRLCPREGCSSYH